MPDEKKKGLESEIFRNNKNQVILRTKNHDIGQQIEQNISRYWQDYFGIDTLSKMISHYLDVDFEDAKKNIKPIIERYNPHAKK